MRELMKAGLLRKKAILTNVDNVCGGGIAQKLAEAQYDLVLTYSSEASKEKLVGLVNRLKEENGIECFLIKADFSKKDTAIDLIAKAVDKLGSLNLLCNNPSPFSGGELEDIVDEELDVLLTSEMRSWIVLMREAARVIFKNETKGSIINISTIRSEKALPGSGLYCGFTAGLNHLTRVFAVEMGVYGVRMNTVEVGFIKASDDELRAKGISEEMLKSMEREGKKVALQRAGTPEEVGDMVVFLASDKASYVTGACVPVDGGLSLAGTPTDFGPITDVCTRSWGAFYPKHLDEVDKDNKELLV